MRTNPAAILALAISAQLILPAAIAPARAQQAKTPYPAMAPIQQYLIADQNAEIALARSAAPSSVSRDATVLVLGRQGYQTAVKGTNGFVCLVYRSWIAGTEDPDFWNPSVRAPICLNAAAVRSYLPNNLMRTRLVLAGKSKEQMAQAITSALDSKELPPQQPGAMCYMMSRQQYLNDQGKSWHPHLMFLVSGAAPADWGANLPGSPIIAANDPLDRFTVFMVWVGHWSDGTPAPQAQN